MHVRYGDMSMFACSYVPFLLCLISSFLHAIQRNLTERNPRINHYTDDPNGFLNKKAPTATNPRALATSHLINSFDDDGHLSALTF
jgi:hypothetical protein